MAHPGKLVEQGLEVVLVAAGTAAGARVHRDRVDPFKKGELPAIALYSPDEEVDEDRSTSTELERAADLELQLFVGGADAEVVSDAMWDIQEQVENAMNANPSISGAAVDSVLRKVSREIVEANGASSPLVGIVTMTYSVTYRTDRTAGAALDDFVTVNATHKVQGGVADTVAPVEQFTVQEIAP